MLRREGAEGKEWKLKKRFNAAPAGIERLLLKIEEKKRKEKTERRREKINQQYDNTPTTSLL